MARYLIVPKRLARALPALGGAAQWLEARAFRFAFRCMKRMSPERAGRVAALAFGLVGPFTQKARKADRNLGIAFPDKSPRWRKRTVRRIFRHLGLSAAELVKLEQIWREREQRLEFHYRPAARALIEAGGPAIFVCAHVGPWQITNLIALRDNLEISTIYAAESNPALRRTMLELRRAFGVNLIPSAAGARPLIKELKAGRCIGMAMDTRPDSGQPIPFFGREALTSTTAARLALRTGAALLPIRAERLGDFRFRITVYDPPHCDEESLSPDERAIELSRRVNRHFEDWIRETPDEWICLKRRWPKAHKL